MKTGLESGQRQLGLSENLNIKVIKKYFFYLFYNLIIVVVFLLLFELFIRLFIPEIQLAGTSKNILTGSLYSSSRGLKENTTGISNGIKKSTNEYHSWKYSGVKSKSKNKILFLGDSVTMGIGVENDSTFAGILNNHFNIINPSVIGYSSHDYVNVFNAFISDNKYDLNYDAVYLFWTLNDVYADSFIQELPAFTPDDKIYRFINFLRHNSKAYLFLKNLISDRSEVYYNFDSKFYSEENELLEKSIENLIYISDKCKEMKIDFFIFLLPYEYQVRNYENESVQKPQETLSESLSLSGIKTIDCITAFKNEFTESHGFYLYGDGIHFSGKGHNKLAEFTLNQVGY
jgi:lysophospholipase L1-like esterase